MGGESATRGVAVRRGAPLPRRCGALGAGHCRPCCRRCAARGVGHLDATGDTRTREHHAACGGGYLGGHSRCGSPVPAARGALVVVSPGTPEPIRCGLRGSPRGGPLVGHRRRCVAVVGDCARCGIFTWAGSAGLSGLDGRSVGSAWTAERTGSAGRRGPACAAGCRALGEGHGIGCSLANGALDRGARQRAGLGESRAGLDRSVRRRTGTAHARCRRRRLIRGRCVSVQR